MRKTRGKKISPVESKKAEVEEEKQEIGDEGAEGNKVKDEMKKETEEREECKAKQRRTSWSSHSSSSRSKSNSQSSSCSSSSSSSSSKSRSHSTSGSSSESDTRCSPKSAAKEQLCTDSERSRSRSCSLSKSRSRSRSRSSSLSRNTQLSWKKKQGGKKGVKNESKSAQKSENDAKEKKETSSVQKPERHPSGEEAAEDNLPSKERATREARDSRDEPQELDVSDEECDFTSKDPMIHRTSSKKDERNSKWEKQQENLDEKPARKRKWGSSVKPSRSTSIDISTDSLKNLIPDFKPTSIKEAILDLSHDEGLFSENEEEKRGMKIRRTVQMKEEEVSKDPDEPREKATENVAPKEEVEEEEKEPAKSGLIVRRISHQLSAPEPEEPMAARQTPSPARNPLSNIIHVRNLVRPFTLRQLKDLLRRSGTIVEEKFWIDKIKSHCFAMFETEDQAVMARNLLHGTKWPSSNPKILRVEYGTEDEVEYYRAKEEGPCDIKREIQQDVTVKAIKSVEKITREIKKDEARHVREWDRDKLKHRSRSLSKSRSISRERKQQRARSKEKRERREKKFVEEAPAKLLDDLFRKTKATPCIYWLPLTEGQIADRENERRQRQLEREKRRRELEEQEKAEQNKRHKSVEKKKEKSERNYSDHRTPDRRQGRSDSHLSREKPRSRSRRR